MSHNPNPSIIDNPLSGEKTATRTNTFANFDPLVGISQSEEITGIPRKTQRRWWEKGKFPEPILYNKRLYWRQSVIEQWLDDNFGYTAAQNTFNQLTGGVSHA